MRNPNSRAPTRKLRDRDLPAQMAQGDESLRFGGKFSFLRNFGRRRTGGQQSFSQSPGARHAARCHGDRRGPGLESALSLRAFPQEKNPSLSSGLPKTPGSGRSKDKGSPPAAYLLRRLYGTRRPGWMFFWEGCATGRPGRSYARERGWGAGP